MKKVLVLAIALIGLNAFSQIDNPVDVTLTVNVGDTYSLVIDGAPTIAMNTPAHFQDGNSVTLGDHITVTASGEYALTVRADQNNFASVQGNTVGVNNVQVSTSNANFVGTPVTLSDAAQNLATSAAGQVNEAYEVTYTIPSGNTSAFLGLGEDTLTTVLTYEVVAN